MFLPGFMEEASPGELRRQLVTQRQAVSEAKVFESLVKRDEPMREVRPEQGDSAVHLVSRAGVERRLRTRKSSQGGKAAGREARRCIYRRAGFAVAAAKRRKPVDLHELRNRDRPIVAGRVDIHMSQK